MGRSSLYVRASWPSRPEPAGACATRAASCLGALAKLSPVLARWKPKAYRLDDALAAAEIPLSRLSEMFERGVNRRDSDGEVIPELGFSWSAWNGMPDTGASVGISCGVWAERIPNSFVLSLPDPTDEPAASLYQREVIERALSAVVEAWDPEWAVATSHVLRESRPWKPWQPVVGWVTYLGPGRAVPPGLAGAEVSPIAAGSMISLSKPWEDVSPADIDDLAVALERSGALAPMVW